MQELKLDKIDEKLISYIFHNFREPLTRIAKKCRISREQVEYRMKKYEQSGLVVGYFTLFNLYSLGYTENYVIKLKVKNPKIDNLSRLRSDGVLIFTKVKGYGNWDYALNVFIKEDSNILDFISKIHEVWKQELLDYDIFKPIEAHFFPLKIFGKKEDDKTLSFVGKKKTKLDSTDEKIIKILSGNAKAKIVKIADKTGEKVETVNYRLKKLEKEIIIGYRIFLDVEKIGYNLSQIILKMNNLSKQTQNKLLEYARQQKRVHAYSIGVGKFNVLLQIIYKTPKEFSEELNMIKKTFAEKITDYELLNFEKELTPKTF